MDNYDQQLPVLDASTVLRFLQTETSDNTTYEVTLPSLDELFDLQTHQTSAPLPDTAYSTPIATRTQRGAPKLVLDGYTYSKKRDLKSSRDWTCTKKGCHGSLKTQGH